MRQKNNSCFLFNLTLRNYENERIGQNNKVKKQPRYTPFLYLKNDT